MSSVHAGLHSLLCQRDRGDQSGTMDETDDQKSIPDLPADYLALCLAYCAHEIHLPDHSRGLFGQYWNHMFASVCALFGTVRPTMI